MHIPIQSPTECPADYYNRKGWHSVLIQSPTECPADCYNRKGWHSVLVQGVVDHRGRFIDVYIGWPGRVHDARVFGNSKFFERGEAGTLFPDWTRNIEGVDILIIVVLRTPSRKVKH